MRLLPVAFACLLVNPALAQDETAAKAPGAETAQAAVPNIATEIVIEDLTLTVKRLRIGVALSPKQIDGLTKALAGAGAKVSSGGEGAGDEGTRREDAGDEETRD